MALQIYDSVAIAPTGVAANLGNGVDDIFIGTEGFLGSQDNEAVYGTGAGHVATVYGSVVAQNNGIYLGDSSTFDSGETVMAMQGSFFYSQSSYGITTHGYDCMVDFAGTVMGHSGIDMWGNGSSSRSELTISGTIDVDTIGVYRNGTEDFTMHNSGTVAASGSYAYFGIDSSGDQKLINKGLFDGTVLLGAGDDVYKERGDGRTTGVLRSYGGDDRLYGGRANDTFIGGADDDLLKGGGGNDVLNGGDGHDRLYGNGGKDKFVFSGTIGNTKVKDFHDGQDKLDFSDYGVNFHHLKQAAHNSHGHLVINVATLTGGADTGHALIFGLDKHHLDHHDVLL